MAGLLLFGMVGAIVAVSVAIGVLTRARAPRTVTGGGVPVGVGRRTAAWRWSGIAAGAAVAGVTASSGALGRGLLLAGPLFGLFVLLGVLAGELGVGAPTGSTRRAAVTVRRARDYLPRHLTRAVTAAAGVLTALLVTTTAMGSADDMGRGGRSLVRHCSPTFSEGHGPWAGSFYSIPLAVVVLAGLTAAILTLHRVIRRPPAGDPTTLTAVDDVLRRRAAHTVMGACGVLIAIPLIGVSLITAAGLTFISCHPSSWTLTAWALIALTPAWVALLAWSGVALLSRPKPTLEPAR